jgi:hypothetical protein
MIMLITCLKMVIYFSKMLTLPIALKMIIIFEKT